MSSARNTHGLYKLNNLRHKGDNTTLAIQFPQHKKFIRLNKTRTAMRETTVSLYVCVCVNVCERVYRCVGREGRSVFVC